MDYDSREVQLNVTRSMGARPQMVLSVFDSRSPGIPTEKPKGTIEITKVGDRISIGRIIKTINPIAPIRIGDIVYSAAWSPNNPTRFALLGKIDVNRDGRDDREELKRMIQEAGGIVDFDLPPPYIGKETGKLTPRIDWFVIDERTPLRDVYLRPCEAIMKTTPYWPSAWARWSRRPGPTASARCRSSGCSASWVTTSTPRSSAGRRSSTSGHSTAWWRPRSPIQRTGGPGGHRPPPKAEMDAADEPAPDRYSQEEGRDPEEEGGGRRRRPVIRRPPADASTRPRTVPPGIARGLFLGTPGLAR